MHVFHPLFGETQIDIATASCVLRDGIALGGDLNIIKTQNNGVFLSYYLNNKKKQEIASLAQGISVVHLYSSQLTLLELSLPKREEQDKIALFIRNTDQKLQAIKKKKTLLEQYKKGVMQKLFSQELRFKDENGKDFPDWEEKRLGELLFEVNEKTKSSNKYRLLSSTTKGLFNQDEYFTRDVASKDNTGYKILKRGQLVFSPQNIWLGNINVNLTFDIGIVSPSYKIFDFNKDLVTPLYCSYFLKTPIMMYEYEQSSVQGASVVRRNLELDKFLNISFLLPTQQEQNRIVNFLSSIDNKINQTHQQIEKTEGWKKGLLQKMFV